MGTNHPEQKFWKPLCEMTGQAELAEDPKYDSAEKRSAHLRELVTHFESVFETRPRDEWLSLLQGAGLMFAPVQDLNEVLADPQARANDYVVDFAHPTLGNIMMPGYPVTFGANSAGTHSAAPTLGEHTDEVLQSLGYSQEAVESMRHQSVIR